MAEYSQAHKLKVGEFFVSENRVPSLGINGISSGSSNVCEDSAGMSLPEVAHAKENLIFKLFKEDVSTKNNTLFVTHSPCIRCTKILANAGISQIYYLEQHKDISLSLTYLQNNFPEIEMQQMYI